MTTAGRRCGPVMAVPFPRSDPGRPKAPTGGQVVAVFAGQFVGMGQKVAQAMVRQPVDDASACLFGLDQATPAQAGQMVRHPALGGAKGSDELADRAVALSEQLQDG